MLVQHWGQHWGPTLLQRSHNIAWTLFQHQSPTLGTDVATTFTQHCLNVVSLSVTNVGADIATMFTQHCVNVVSMSVTNVGDQRCHNVHATLPQHWYNFSQCWYNIAKTFTQCCGNVASQCCGNIAKCLQVNIVPTLGTNIVTTFAQRFDNVVTTLVC